uniref:50S ribosomal protein L9, chloroplastic n=1 Tax=Polysiphonia infestans TaxID=2006978 RepID=A0A1Z1MFB8_9FLOR|nr:ribosomal protein L9 [Polysiphonia infestans]ARW64444.1 ribosomal protein L9 [Polysiphonia infestans]
MKRKIQIIIREKNEYLISVARGHAFNYLIPKKNAQIPTKKRIKHLEMFQEIRTNKSEVNKVKIQKMINEVEKINKISIYKKRGGNQLIFGSITEKEISTWILTHTNLQIERSQINISEIKKTGIKDLTINIKKNISKKLQINIIPVNI